LLWTLLALLGNASKRIFPKILASSTGRCNTI